MPKQPPLHRKVASRITATARYPDENEPLREAGATAVFNVYAEAGVGFAGHVEGSSPLRKWPEMAAGRGKMASADNEAYGEPAMTGSLAMLMTSDPQANPPWQLPETWSAPGQE